MCAVDAVLGVCTAANAQHQGRHGSVQCIRSTAQHMSSPIVDSALACGGQPMIAHQYLYCTQGDRAQCAQQLKSEVIRVMPAKGTSLTIAKGHKALCTCILVTYKTRGALSSGSTTPRTRLAHTGTHTKLGRVLAASAATFAQAVHCKSHLLLSHQSLTRLLVPRCD